MPPCAAFMDYSDDACYEYFTDGQFTRMQWAWATFRAPQSSAPAPQEEQSSGGLDELPPATPAPTKAPTRAPTKAPTKVGAAHSPRWPA